MTAGLWRRCFNMVNFKAQLERDLKAVFLNGKEFAEVKEIGYNGNYYKVPVAIDSEGAKDRQKPSTDNAEGIFAVDMVMYAAYSDFGVMPKQGQPIEIDGDIFRIASVQNEMGQLILNLRRLTA